MTIPSGATTWQSDPNWSPTSPTMSKTTPAKVTPSQSGYFREATRAPPSSAKSQCGGRPTASTPKTRDQPEEEANSKRSRPCGNNASTGLSRVPPTRQQMRGPTSDRQDAPHSAQATTGNARTRDPNGVRAGRPRPADSTPQPSHRGAQNMRLHAARQWQDRQHTAESGSSFQIKRRVRPAGACPRFAAGRAAEMVSLSSGFSIQNFTASDMLQELDVWLNEQGASLVFAEMKDPCVKRSSSTSSRARSTQPTSLGRSTGPSPSAYGRRTPPGGVRGRRYDDGSRSR